MKLFENPALQSEQLWFKQLLVSLFGQAQFFERQSHCSDLIEQYTGLNCILMWQCGTRDKPGTSSFQQNTIQSACHTHPTLLVSTILDLWTPNFKATVISTFVGHLLWKFTKWLKTCWKNVVSSFVEFLRTVLKLCPTKSCGIAANMPYWNTA